MIKIDELNKSFGDTAVFKEFSAEFEDGSVTCIMGSSGIGKTTLLRILMGLEDYDDGRITGIENKTMAAVFQEDRLCENLTVSANIRMTGGKDEKGISEQEVVKYLEIIGMKDMAGKQVSELSGGMKRRVAILRAVLADRDIVFFDEPLKGLDQETEKKVMETIVPLLSGKTVLWVTHREDEAAYFKNANMLKL
ncbi:ATP-binding cassette domain-containing protein [Gallibacter intestinalis]|uniref:ABC transporter ATP-binding protein n=1 Tax=Gallibacter intestinalis TaxID=2779356 RepID=A0ABR9QWK6_9FIRM|nr:ATP-binding cassette domain-containing protein [Gallibacter intestinalis]MBE5035251.1 ABC transporter ATP-binding protein [Gallibacter intestinalis]